MLGTGPLKMLGTGRSVAVNLTRNGHTNPITRRSIESSNVNTVKAQIVTCNVVVGLVLCKSSDGSRVVFLGGA